MFHSVIDPPWTLMKPIRIGHVPAALSTADRFVTVDSEQGPLLRVDLYRSSEESSTFEQLCMWSGFIAIGWGHHLYLVKPLTREASALDLGSYFGRMYATEQRLLVASAECLCCVGPHGSLLWRSDTLGIDGVVVDQVLDGKVHGQGEWDPPGGWRPFSVSLYTGREV